MSDHYAVLEIQQTATASEITAAFRRLARIHHPDKNPQNTDEATERFKQIQQAYEVLSDEEERRRYDAIRILNSSRAASGYGDSSTGHTYFGDPNSVISQTLEEILQQMVAERQAAYMAAALERQQEILQQMWERRAAYMAEGFERQQEEKAKRERQEREQQESEQRQKKFEEKQARERREREARAAAKKAKEEDAKREKLVARDREAAKQEARWLRVGAATEEEKFSACLHSAFCTKIAHRKKVKCDACNAKRGVMAFKCPYCARLLCQMCVTNSAQERAQDAA